MKRGGKNERKDNNKPQCNNLCVLVNKNQENKSRKKLLFHYTIWK